MMKYTITRYQDGEPLAEISMSRAEFAVYMRHAQQPEGAITLGGLRGLVSTAGEYDDLPGEEVIFLMDGPY